MSRAARRLSTALLVGSITALTSCADAGLAWEFSVDPTVTDADIVGASIRRGACEAGGNVLASYFFRRGEEAPVDPLGLGEGSFCFVVELYRADCVPVALGETSVALPPDAVDVVRVDAVATAPREADARCLTFLSTTGG